jgi:hypothetical protein
MIDHVPCQFRGRFSIIEACTGEAAKFFLHPDLNEYADKDIWIMPVCPNCAKIIESLQGIISISKNEYCVYQIMLM